MAPLPTKVLVRQLKEGDLRACTHLVDRYQPLLLNEAVHTFSLRTDDAEEIVSDVLLAVVKGIGRFSFQRGEGDFHVWVMAIFRNKVRDFVRQRALHDGLVFLDEVSWESDNDSTENRVTHKIVNDYQAGLQEINGDWEESQTDAIVAGKLAAIADTLERLDAWERVLLRCRALGVPYEEIALYTGRPASHLKVYHARVQKKFVQMLAEYYPELKPYEEPKPE